jgi:hypothetical protein
MAPDRLARLVYIGLLLVSCLYVVQLASPLRLNTDAMTYLSLAASAADGHGFVDGPKTVRFPPGYPAIIALSDKAGVVSPALLVAINLLFLGLAALCTVLIGLRHFRFSTGVAAACGTAVLLSFVVVKHATLPVAESVFTGAVLASLYLLVVSDRNHGVRRWIIVGLAAAIVLISIQLRTVGIALIPAVLFAILTPGYRYLAARNSKGRLIAILVVASVAAAVVLAVLLARSAYVDDVVRIIGYGDAAGIASRNLRWKLLEWGALVVNVPETRLPAAAAVPLMAIGLSGIGLVTYGAWCQRMFGPVAVFALVYALIIFLWPGYDTRFWLPLLPVLILYAASGMRALSRRKVPRAAVSLYLVAYFALGLAALTYSARISLAGERFPYLYGDHHLRPTYLLIHHGEPGPGKINPRALRLLQRYEPRTHPNAIEYVAP